MKWLFAQIRKLIARLLPREEQFFEHFLEMLGIIKESIGIINSLRADNVKKIVDAIEENEDRSDQIEFTIHQKLKGSITTPPQLNREGIIDIASSIDNVMDSLKSVSKRLEAGDGELVLLLNDKFNEFWHMIDKLDEATDLSIEIIRDFSHNSLEANDPRIKRIHDIENEIDALHIQYITKKLYYSDLAGKDLVIMQVIGRIEGSGDDMQRLVKKIQEVLVSG
jgi:predicted phosphate transport protein (TIGR00153 family)